MIDDMKCKVHIYFFREVENQKGECVCVASCLFCGSMELLFLDIKG